MYALLTFGNCFCTRYLHLITFSKCHCYPWHIIEKKEVV